jgi:hypothetical protein
MTIYSWISYFASHKLNLNHIITYEQLYSSNYGFHTTTKQCGCYIYLVKVCCVNGFEKNNFVIALLCDDSDTHINIQHIYRDILYMLSLGVTLLYSSIFIQNHGFSFGFGIKLNNHPFLLLQTHAYILTNL